MHNVVRPVVVCVRIDDRESDAALMVGVHLEDDAACAAADHGEVGQLRRMGSAHRCARCGRAGEMTYIPVAPRGASEERPRLCGACIAAVMAGGLVGVGPAVVAP